MKNKDQININNKNEKKPNIFVIIFYYIKVMIQLTTLDNKELSEFSFLL